jgi:hypothetical protein
MLGPFESYIFTYVLTTSIVDTGDYVDRVVDITLVSWYLYNL